MSLLSWWRAKQCARLARIHADIEQIWRECEAELLAEIEAAKNNDE